MTNCGYANFEGMLIKQIDLTARVHRTYLRFHGEISSFYEEE